MLKTQVSDNKLRGGWGSFARWSWVRSLVDMPLACRIGFARKTTPPSLNLLFPILALAVLLRIVYLIQHMSSPYFEPMLLDPGYYHEWAVSLLNGNWIRREAFFGLPLYPAFLFVMYKISSLNILFVKGAQLLLGVFNVFLIFKLTEELFSRRAVSLIAALFAAVYAPYIFHEVIFIPEVLSIPLYTASLLMILRLWTSPGLKKACLTGLLMGLAGLTKAGIFIFVILFFFVFLLKSKVSLSRRVTYSLMLVFSVCITISPVTFHNWKASNDFVPLTSHGGLNFFIGNNPLANGLFKAPPGVRSNIQGQREDSKLIAEKTLGRQLKPSEVSSFWFNLGLKFISRQPGHALLLAVNKLGLFLNHQEISDVEDIRFSKRYAPLLDFLWMGFSVLFVFALPGILWGWNQVRSEVRMLWLLWVLSYLTGVISFFVVARYRLPLLSALIPFAALGLSEVYQALRSMRLGKVFLMSFIGLLALIVTRIPLAEPDFAVQYANVGNILVKENRIPEAVAMYEKAIQTNPDYVKVYNDLGVAYKKSSEFEKSRQAFRQAVKHDPDNAHAYNNLGLLEYRLGNTHRAEYYFVKAVKLKPNLAEAYNNLGMLYGERGEPEKAWDVFGQSLAIHPENPRVLSNMALIAYRKGDHRMARKLWQKTLEIDPHYPDALKALQALDSRS